MAKIDKLTVTLVTGRVEDAGSDATFYIDFLQYTPRKSIGMPNMPEDENEAGRTTIYNILNPDLYIEDFRPGFVELRNDNSGHKPGWFCRAVFINAIDNNNRNYSLVSMENVNRWLAADEPGGLTMPLEVRANFGFAPVISPERRERYLPEKVSPISKERYLPEKVSPFSGEISQDIAKAVAAIQDVAKAVAAPQDLTKAAGITRNEIEKLSTSLDILSQNVDNINDAGKLAPLIEEISNLHKIYSKIITQAESVNEKAKKRLSELKK